MTIQELYNFGKEHGVLNYDIVIREGNGYYGVFDIVRPGLSPIITSSKEYEGPDLLTDYIVTI